MEDCSNEWFAFNLFCFWPANERIYHLIWPTHQHQQVDWLTANQFDIIHHLFILLITKWCCVQLASFRTLNSHYINNDQYQSVAINAFAFKIVMSVWSIIIMNHNQSMDCDCDWTRKVCDKIWRMTINGLSWMPFHFIFSSIVFCETFFSPTK